MIALVDKYRHVFAMGLQGGIVYRWNFLIRVLFSLLQLAVVVTLWRAAYSGKEAIAGRSFAEMMSYFLVMTIANYFISAFNEDYQIGEEIRGGTINQFLTKPIDYFGYRLTLFFASRAVTGAITIIPILVCLPLLLDFLPQHGEWWRYALALPAFFLSALIQFCIAFCFGLLAFWFLEIQGFVILSLAIETTLSGQMFPLDLLPPAALAVVKWLPFYYQAYFPVAIVTNPELDAAAIQDGFLIQLGWVVLLFALGRLLWARGLRRHTAVGG
jgi:ABC-2 type transport system permease protein